MKVKFLVLILLLTSNLMFAQSTADIFNSSTAEITWCGLDFSKVKLVGQVGFTDPIQIKNQYFTAWNGLILSEPSKYDLKKTFLKNKFNHNITVVEQGNNAVNVTEMVINESALKLERKDLEAIVKSYNVEVRDQIGLVFIIESFDKLAEKATVHVTFFNTKTKEIIFTDVVVGSPKGFGFRNYWAGAICDVLDIIRSKKFKSWQKLNKTK